MEMGGDREFTAPAKSTSDISRVVGDLRIHENSGEVHFHDDKNGLKVAVPVDTMYAAWDRLSDGRKSKFKYKDLTNGTQLRMKVVARKNAPIDLNVEVRQLKKKDLVNIKSNDFQAFDRFIKGSTQDVG